MSVLIEFTEDTAKRSKGDRLRVDEGSAKSFVDKKKVAKLVDEAAEAAAEVAAAEAPVSRTVKSAPAPAGGGE